MTLRWKDNASTETSYEVERMGPGDAGFSLLVSLPPDSIEHIDRGLPTSAYLYRVRAEGAVESSGACGPATAVVGEAFRRGDIVMQVAAAEVLYGSFLISRASRRRKASGIAAHSAVLSKMHQAAAFCGRRARSAARPSRNLEV